MAKIYPFETPTSKWNTDKSSLHFQHYCRGHLKDKVGLVCFFTLETLAEVGTTTTAEDPAAQNQIESECSMQPTQTRIKLQEKRNMQHIPAQTLFPPKFIPPSLTESFAKIQTAGYTFFGGSYHPAAVDWEPQWSTVRPNTTRISTAFSQHEIPILFLFSLSQDMLVQGGGGLASVTEGDKHGG